jgi:carbohydrate diacid regulator
MRDVVGRNIGVIDDNGIVIASSEAGRIGESKQRIKEELSYSAKFIISDGYTYRFINSQGKSDFIAFVEGDDLHANKMSEILSISLGNIKSLYDEKYDKVSFVKNIILDNILPSDIYIKSNELHFSEEFRATSRGYLHIWLFDFNVLQTFRDSTFVACREASQKGEV